jgi:gas vesicle protein
MQKQRLRKTPLKVLPRTQRKLINQQNNIDELKHKLHDNLSNIQNQVMEYAGFMSETSSAENVDLYDQYLTIEKLVNEIRQEFNRFASKWM